MLGNWELGESIRGPHPQTYEVGEKSPRVWPPGQALRAHLQRRCFVASRETCLPAVHMVRFGDSSEGTEVLPRVCKIAQAKDDSRLAS